MDRLEKIYEEFGVMMNEDRIYEDETVSYEDICRGLGVELRGHLPRARRGSVRPRRDSHARTGLYRRAADRGIPQVGTMTAMKARRRPGFQNNKLARIPNPGQLRVILALSAVSGS